MEVVLLVTVLFTQALALAFLVERFLEILKAIYDLIDSRFDLYKFWTRRAEKIRDGLEKKMQVYEYLKSKEGARLLNRFQEMLLKEPNGYFGTIPMLSGDLVRMAYVKVALKLTGILAGIGLAFWMNIDLIAVWKSQAGNLAIWDMVVLSPALRITISGAIIGMGSDTVHKLITMMEKKKKRIQQEGGRS
jgi:hypothetical protein